MSAARGKLIVSGIVFWYPLAGVTYQFLHYLIGLRQLGWFPPVGLARPTTWPVMWPPFWRLVAMCLCT